MKRKTSFIKFIRVSGIIFLLTLSGIFIVIDLISSYREFNIRAEKMRKDYILEQKKMIKQEVIRVIDMINHEKTKAETLTKNRIKSRVYEAYEIATHIYRENQNLKNKVEIQKQILEALRAIRFGNTNECYKIIDLTGKIVLDPLNPSNEGLSCINLKDYRGNYIIKDMINIAKEAGEGFYQYIPISVNNSANRQITNHNKKISFIKLFKPLNWCITAGLYQNEATEKIKKELLERISKIRFDKEGYIFVNRLNGDALVSNGKVFSGRRKLWEIFNKNPQKTREIFQKEYRAALKPGGDYIDYSWVKLKGPHKESPKTSFVRGIPELKWLVGAGVYLDDIERDILTMHSQLTKQILNKLSFSILIILTVVVLFLFLYNLLTRRLENDFNLFISFFNRAAFSNEPIDLKMVKFVEFEEMAKNANSMLADKINAQQQLMEEREQLFVTIHSIGDGVITTDVKGRVELMNSVAEHLTGWREQEAKGKLLTDIFHIINETTREKAQNPVARVLREGRIVGLANHTVLISKNGVEYNIADSAAPIKDPRGNILGVVLVFRDVTEKLKTEKELLKTKKLESIGVLAGGIAHDFNNILTGLFGNIELAKLEIPPDHPAFPYIQLADQAMERATKLTKQLLTFAKGGEPILETMDLKPIIEDTVRFNLSGSSIKAHFKFQKGLWHVKIDKGQISQVVANLTINAKEAMPEGGNLYIEAENFTTTRETSIPHPISGDFVKLIFRDEGIGIHPKDVEKIFDPYFTTKKQGSGLGLAVAHSIIIKHKGYIGVKSTPGKGTTFTIYLPAEKQSATKKTSGNEQSHQPTNSYSGYILIMDDEEIVRSVAKAMLKSLGYRVELARDGNEALQKYREAMKSGAPFDAVIMDLTIPGGLGGKETIKKLLDIDPQARVIVSSGYSTDPIMAKYASYGFKGRILKPFKLEDIKRELTKVLGERKA